MRSRLVGPRIAIFALCSLLGLVGLAACDQLSPGNEGFACKSSDDCKAGLHCRAYRFRGSKRTKRFCTGRRALSSSKQTYGWALIIAAWVLLIGLPIGTVVAVVAGRRKKRTQGPPPPGAAAPPGAAPPGTAPPADPGHAA